MEDYEKNYFSKEYNKSGEGSVISKVRAEMLVEELPKVKKILDIGCAYGDFLLALEKKGIEVVGVDISSYALDKARKRLKGDLLKLDVSVEKLPFEDDAFDAVAILDLVEHLDSPDFLFSQTLRALKPKGKVLITTPNDQGYLGKLLQLVFPDDPTHVNVRSSGYWREKLTKAGFSQVRVRASIMHGFPPMYKARQIAKRFKLPIIQGPLFFPIEQLCGYLYIFASKG